jgi:hypothetical protein
MKLRRVHIEVNDDGTYQIEAMTSGGMMDGIKLSAKSIEEIPGKIKEAQSKMDKMKKGKERNSDLMKYLEKE